MILVRLPTRKATVLCFFFSYDFNLLVGKMGEGQILKRQNVERSIFRNFKTANIKITKDQSIVLFSNLFFHFLEIV